MQTVPAKRAPSNQLQTNPGARIDIGPKKPRIVLMAVLHKQVYRRMEPDGRKRHARRS